ncbi:acyl-CoA-binding domain-containing protein 6 isoform X3 [Lepidochelys kempii]|uniref:acyl-CoA-binding domain-containing protein 6 isoform X1 n=1 Tax=Caretta caretta TaxID=8467 RepID=UPI002095AE83|nr:acyl-CoA-binding domain-containing protein 6 isoform X1 [Caretta caretta]
MASPFPASAGNSGGEPSSGEESGGPEEEARALAEQFERAAERLPGLMQAASREQLLYLYARYKQVKFGNCNTPKPSFFDFEGKQKWEAWKALGDSSSHQAMQEYIATVKKLDPSWNPQTPEKRGKEGKTGFGGPVVSSLYQEETIREEDKNIFDYCRENNIDHVTKVIQSKKVDVNMKDEEGKLKLCMWTPPNFGEVQIQIRTSWHRLIFGWGRALLHWACDRGHKELVSVLLQHAADVNSQDDEGQTALHYASACEFFDIVELLLKSGADPTLLDQEGCLPEEVTDCKAITSLLQQHTAGKT